MWKAFLYLSKQDKFTFVFQFELQDTCFASILLKEYDSKCKKIIFQINCSDVFSQKFASTEELIGTNMLCRPCLVELSEDYYLREQTLPFFITLAHEFLHAL